jgi:hypothetical protein
MSPSTAGALESPSLFSGVSLLKNMMAKETRGQNVTDAKSYGLGTIFHNCQSTKISGVTSSGLKDFHCNNKI